MAGTELAPSSLQQPAATPLSAQVLDVPPSTPVGFRTRSRRSSLVEMDGNGSSTAVPVAAAFANPDAFSSAFPGSPAMINSSSPAADTNGRLSYYFIAPAAGLVLNKPFSLELRCSLEQLASSSSSAAALNFFRALIFRVACKITAKPMEKRSNTYTPIPGCWLRAEEQPAGTDPSASATALAALSVAAASHAIGKPEPPGSPLQKLAVAASAASAFSSPVRLSPPSPQPGVPASAGRNRSKKLEALRDRTIGHQLLITESPSEREMASSETRTVEALLSRMFVSITQVSQQDRVGLLELVTTKGGTDAYARPRQRSEIDSSRKVAAE
jgi:hypothetical protein